MKLSILSKASIILLTIGATACASPDTQVGKSTQTGAALGAFAALLFGGDTEDIVESAVAGGFGGAMVGSAKSHEQQLQAANAIARQEVQQNARLEQQRIDLEKERLNQQRVIQPISVVEPAQRSALSTNSKADMSIETRRPRQASKSLLDDQGLLERAFGKDSIDGLFALRDCQHSTAKMYAAAAKNSNSEASINAGNWLTALIALDEHDENKANETFDKLTSIDSDVSSARQAKEQTLDALLDIRSERKALAISCSV